MAQNDDKFIRRLDINDVKVGMYLEDIFDHKGTLLLSSKEPIVSMEKIEILKNRGITSVLINEKRKNNYKFLIEPIEKKKAPPIENNREARYYKELTKAVSIHKDGVVKAAEVLKAVRNSQSFNLAGIQATAEEIVRSLVRNPDALVSLSQLKGYDDYTFVHSVNVAVLVTSLAQSMGYPDDKLLEIGIGGLLHDIGKMKIPEQILNKPSKLTDTEFAIIKRHPELGVEQILGKKGISDISKKIILQHHERYNGTGYPLGLTGERIHEVGLISAVADVYDALTSDRVYKAAWTPQKALILIFKGCDKDYSRRIVELFMKHMGIYPVGSFVKLGTNELGVVVKVNKGELLAPEVLLLIDHDGRRLAEPIPVKLSEKQKEANGHRYKILVSLNPKAFNVNVNEYIQHQLH